MIGQRPAPKRPEPDDERTHVQSPPPLRAVDEDGAGPGSRPDSERQQGPAEAAKAYRTYTVGAEATEDGDHRRPLDTGGPDVPDDAGRTTGDRTAAAEDDGTLLSADPAAGGDGEAEVTSVAPRVDLRETAAGGQGGVSGPRLTLLRGGATAGAAAAAAAPGAADAQLRPPPYLAPPTCQTGVPMPRRRSRRNCLPPPPVRDAGSSPGSSPTWSTSPLSAACSPWWA